MKRSEVIKRHSKEVLTLTELTDDRYLYESLNVPCIMDVLRGVNGEQFNSVDTVENLMNKFKDRPYVIKTLEDYGSDRYTYEPDAELIAETI